MIYVCGKLTSKYTQLRAAPLLVVECTGWLGLQLIFWIFPVTKPIPIFLLSKEIFHNLVV